MNPLPTGWVTATIGDLSDDCSQRVPRIDEVFQYIDISSIDRDAKRIATPQTLVGAKAPSRARKEVRAGDVLVSLTRPNLNAVALVPAELDGQIASTGFDVLRPVGSESRWLFYLVRTKNFVDSMSGLVQGALYPAIRSKDVRGFKVQVAPLAEQKRIADKLDVLLARVDACRARIDRVSEFSARFRLAILAAATSGRLTRDWREERSLESWPEVELGDVAGGFSYGSAAKSARAGTVPVLRMGNIQDGLLDWEDLVFTSDAVEIEKYRLASGDVLFNRTNSPELVGKTAVFRGERIAIYAGYLIRVRCGERLLPDYLNYCLGSPAGREYCWRVKSDGVSQSNINAKKLAAFTFNLPTVAEQEEIIRRVEELLELGRAISARVESASRAIERLTACILSKAFRGELLPQDAGDEGATALLGSIKAGRKESAKFKRRPKNHVEMKPVMKSSSKDEIKAAILKLRKASLTFDEIVEAVPGDYESIKEALFELLEDSNPVVRQVFNRKAKSMRIERVKS